MSMCSMPSGASASRIAWTIVCGAAMQPAWPAPLTPSGLTCGRQLGERDLERRQVVGARQRVIHQRAAQQLARAVVVDRVFEHRLADPLREPALDLARVSIGLISRP